MSYVKVRKASTGTLMLMAASDPRVGSAEFPLWTEPTAAAPGAEEVEVQAGSVATPSDDSPEAPSSGGNDLAAYDTPIRRGRGRRVR